MSKPTDVKALLGSLGAGVTEQILAKVLSDSSVAVLTNDAKKKATVTLQLDISRMSADSDEAVKIDAKLSFKVPTKRGDKQENETRETVMYYDPQRGLVDTAPKRKEEASGFGMDSGMPVGHEMRGS